jgi:endonuclease YncB( thermonuclease family)
MDATTWPRYHYTAEALRVKDGDTLVVRADLGFDVHHVIALRLNGLWCPELHGSEKERAVKAKEHLWGLVEGKQLFVRTFKDKRTFERYVADVLVRDESGQLVSVVEAMRAAGFDDGPPKED